MKQKFNIKNIVIAALFLTTISSLVLWDHHRVENDFMRLKADLMRIRLQSVTENKPLIFKFNENEVSVLEFPDGPLLETLQFSTISKVMYDTTIGKDMIVFHAGTTSMHNKRIHGGEIVLKSWLGFSRHIHVNCAGLAEEGRYPET
jgi:hypothetical protein